LNVEGRHDSPSIVNIREEFQYGTGLTLKDEVFDDLFKLSRHILNKTKDIVEGVKG